MKTQLLAAPAAALALTFALSACGVHRDSNGTINTPASTVTAPTVTVTAPTTPQTVGFAFNVAWTSTDATSCAADFDSADTGTTATYAATEKSAGTKTYTVTCTGTGGSTTASATVTINASPIAEGVWQGTTADDRAIAGVVTHPDATTNISQYFLTYSAAGDHATAAGFIAGGGTSIASTTIPTDGTFASGSSTTNAQREFNFEGVGASGGDLTATYTQLTSFGGSFTSTPLSTTWSFDNTSFAFDADSSFYNASGVWITFTQSPITDLSVYFSGAVTDVLPFTDGGTPAGAGTETGAGAWNINVTDPANPTFSGNLILGQYIERVWLAPTNYADLSFSAGSHMMAFSLTSGGATNTVAYNAGTRTLTWQGTFTNTIPVMNSADFTCDGPAASIVCAIFPPLPVTGNVTLVFNDSSLTTYHGTIDWYQGASTPLPTAEWAFTGSAVPPPVTQTYTSTYNAAYATAPSLTDIQGSYTGSAGIDVAMTASSALNIAADGTVSGTSGTCAYNGTVTPATVGNVYNVTLTFSDNGSACAYTSSGSFTGAARYDATTKQVDITAVNATRDKGFLFEGTKP